MLALSASVMTTLVMTDDVDDNISNESMLATPAARVARRVTRQRPAACVARRWQRDATIFEYT